jgi:hypothetical protein
LHVEKEERGFVLRDEAAGLGGVGGFARDFDFGVRLEEVAKLGASEAFVVDDEGFDHVVVAGVAGGVGGIDVVGGVDGVGGVDEVGGVG